MTVCLSTNGPSVHHCDAQPARLLVATTHGINVLARHPDGWREVGRVMDGYHISALMIEPQNRTIFAGVHHGGLYSSSDGGATWERRTEGLTREHVYSLGYTVRNGRAVLYAGTEPVSLFCSDDGGRTWTELPEIGRVPGHEKWTFPPPPHLAHTKALTFDPRNPEIIYAAIEQGALLKSSDGGRTWRELGSFYCPDDAWYKDVHRVVCRPFNPDELFMATGIGLYRSLDAGETWARLTGEGHPIGYPDQLIFDPLDPRVLFMSGAGRDPTTWRTSHHAGGTVMRSTDDGATWSDASQGLPQGSHTNIEALNAAAYPGGYALFAGNTDGEVFISENGGRRWERIMSGLKPISKGGHFRNLQPGLKQSVEMTA